MSNNVDNPSCNKCGLMKSTIIETGKSCVGGLWHIFPAIDGKDIAYSVNIAVPDASVAESKKNGMLGILEDPKQYPGMAPKRTVLRIAFDVDGTLIKMGAYGDVPRFEIVALAKLFIELGHTVFIWSGGGKEHAENWAKKLGLWPEARVIEKRGDAFDIDIAFDDMACSLAKVDVIV